jgi:hypothetical protein
LTQRAAEKGDFDSARPLSKGHKTKGQTLRKEICSLLAQKMEFSETDFGSSNYPELEIGL